jgi:hypothetical protein
MVRRLPLAPFDRSPVNRGTVPTDGQGLHLGDAVFGVYRGYDAVGAATWQAKDLSWITNVSFVVFRHGVDPRAGHPLVSISHRRAIPAS